MPKPLQLDNPLFTPPDSRNFARYPLELELCYAAQSQTGDRSSGTGRSVNISSGGLLFTAGEHLKSGTRIEISINWPAKLEGKVGLRLWMWGRVVRSQTDQAAVEIDRHEFRTASREAEFRNAAIRV